jgi:hypothetical protein
VRTTSKPGIAERLDAQRTVAGRAVHCARPADAQALSPASPRFAARLRQHRLRPAVADPRRFAQPASPDATFPRDHARMSFLRSAEPEKVHSASQGRCYLYVLPCAYEDLLKLGFSRNPLSRAQQLQPRYFEFFDLDRAFAVQTDSVREARAMELRLRRALTEHNAPAPLTIRVEAAGHSEWYRGAYAMLDAQAQAMQAQGHLVHRPLRPWLGRELAEQGDLLFARAAELLDQLQGEP